MITPYPPPQGPRVELLRVRRVDPTLASERSGPAPLRDPADTLPAAAVVGLSADPVRLLTDDPQTTTRERGNP